MDVAGGLMVVGFYQQPETGRHRRANLPRPRLLCMLALSRVSLAIPVGTTHSIRTAPSQLHEVFKGRNLHWDRLDKERMCKWRSSFLNEISTIFKI